MKVHIVVDGKGVVQASGPVVAHGKGDQPHATLRAGPNQTVHELEVPDAEFGKLSPVAMHDRIAKGDWKQFAPKKTH